MFKVESDFFGARCEELDSDFVEKGLKKPAKFSVFRLHYPDLNKGENECGHFVLAPMPGCCGVVVSTDSYINPKWRGGALSKPMHNIKEKAAKALGYTTMIATVQARNYPEVVGASNSGWRFLHTFRNKRTSNDIGIMVKDIV